MIINMLITALMILVGIISAIVCFSTFFFAIKSIRLREWENALIYLFFSLLIFFAFFILLGIYLMPAVPIEV